MIDFNQLNPQQLQAVRHLGSPILVFAGAGSGKTRVLTYKMAYLIEEVGLPPENILAVTFTNKAASEMRNRVNKLISLDLSRLNIGTFHSISASILRKNIHHLGYENNLSRLLGENSKEDLIEAFDGSMQNAPSNWWWKKFIPKFTYAFLVKNLIRNKKKITCNLKPLSKVIEELSLKKIDLLKIDCEGNEHKVINGINKQNWSIINQLIIEINDIDDRLKYIENKLKKLGFKIKIIQEPALEKTNLYNLFAKK